MPNTSESYQDTIETLIPQSDGGELVSQLFPGTEVKKEDSYEKVRSDAITAAQEISRGDVNAGSVGKVLKAWKHSFEQKEDILPVDEDSYEQRQHWIEEASSFTRVLRIVVGEDRQFEGIKPDEKLDRMNQLLSQEDFEEKGLLLEFLAQRVWSYYDLYDQSKSKYEGVPPGQLHLEAEEALKVTVETLTPVFSENIPALTRSSEGKASIRRIFEHLQGAEQKVLADSILLNEDMSENERLAVAVQYINVFGFIPTIETISQHAKTREDIKALYSRLEGDRVEEVMADLWEVYKKYEQESDFSQYYEDEVTKKDLSIIEKWSSTVAEKFGKNRGELNAVSLAAGKGRMAFSMENSGFRVVAVEPQTTYAQSIREHIEGRNIRVVQKLWGELSTDDLSFNVTQKDLEAQGMDEEYVKAMGGVENILKIVGKRNLLGVEIGESTGRNLPHGNSPQRLLEAFDAIRTVSKDGAIWVVDVMDPFSGRYEQNITSLRNNLLNLGVDPLHAYFTFEGPKSNLRFNRMTVSREQMDAYAELMGLKVKETIEDTIGEGETAFKNVYYVLEVDQDYYPQKLSPERLHELLAITGLTDPGVELNEKVKSWGVSIGQALVFGFPETKGYRESLGDVRFIRNGGKTQIEGYRH